MRQMLLEKRTLKGDVWKDKRIESWATHIKVDPETSHVYAFDCEEAANLHPCTGQVIKK
jgi:hypothetical protein